MGYRKAIEKKEIKYIKKRQRQASIERCIYYLFRLFPIEENKIAVCTFEGKGGFGCNPKYVVQELHNQNPEMKFVWLVNPDKSAKDGLTDKEFPEYVKPVSNKLLSRAFHLTTSKIWIDNYRKPLGTAKRNGQYYINVNHFTVGIKCTGLHREEGFSEMAYLVNKHDSEMIDHLVIDSDWCESCFDKAMVYDGEYLKVGSPRCDVLYGDKTEQRQAFRRKHNLPLNAKIVMYAPTFREGAKDGKRFVFSETWTLNFERLLERLEEKFGGEWYLCVRVHPQLAPTFAEYKNDKMQGRVIDESQADDMYEILASMDAYITDYSSACFEAGFAKIPVFIYADDISQYAHDRGRLMWDLTTSQLNDVRNNKDITSHFDVKFPFTIATNNEELVENINLFQEKLYEENMDKFCDEIGLIFSGNASRACANKIEEVIEKGIL